jgi:hypothetical protein
VRAELLISTGAKTSVIDRATLTALGLGEGEAQYDVSLKFSFDQGRPLIWTHCPSPWASSAARGTTASWAATLWRPAS